MKTTRTEQLAEANILSFLLDDLPYLVKSLQYDMIAEFDTMPKVGEQDYNKAVKRVSKILQTRLDHLNKLEDKRNAA